MSIDLSSVEVRRNNGQNDYDPWTPVADEGVPEWVGEMIADEIAENDQDAGKIERAGSAWSWRKA